MIDYDKVADTVAVSIDDANAQLDFIRTIDNIDSRVDTALLQAIVAQNAAIITLLSTLVAQGKNNG